MAFSSTSHSARNDLLLNHWRQSLNPITVDIVGDFAGKELFSIHGEALIAHCISSARVDYEYGCQLLHAVHAVESILVKLRDRGCNFHVVWFDSDKELCIPPGTSPDFEYKYLLTRVVLIQHFARQSTPPFSHRFDSITCDRFQQYLLENPQCFFMCSDGRARSSNDHPRTIACSRIGYYMCYYGYCVAFIDGITFGSSRVSLTSFRTHFTSSRPRLTISQVCVAVATPRRLLPLEHDQHDAQNDISSRIILDHPEIYERKDLTSRDIVTLHALSDILSSGVSNKKRKGAMLILLQLVLLRNIPISQRSFQQEGAGLTKQYHTTFKEFCQIALEIIDIGTSNAIGVAKWDLYDLVDGRLYLETCRIFLGPRLPEDLITEISELAKLLTAMSGVELLDLLPGHPADSAAEALGQPVKQSTGEMDQAMSTVLPFSHPIVDQYLQHVQLDTEEEIEIPYSQIFQDLTHWHNAKRPIDHKNVPKLSFWARERARKRIQFLMADTLVYSASLTGALGKIIDRQTIVVTDKNARPSRGPKNNSEPQPRSPAPGKSRNQKTNVKPGKGKQNAHQAVEATILEKTERESVAAIKSWRDRLNEFEKTPSLIKRVISTENYLSKLSSAHKPHVNAEISLYICLTLLHLCRRAKSLPQASHREPSLGLASSGIEALLWSKVFVMNGMNLTREILSQLHPLSNSLGIPLNVGVVSTLPRRALPPAMANIDFKLPQSSGAVSDPIRFQLSFCGPYMERSFDSAPDSRARFHPDAWQRKVLDAIDADKSLFVVAPTSAGKTFISFYAMEKILLANDDDVIVYVAPTKALVNQIAAEVQARFSKSYSKESRCVWSVHTRDYRINSPQGCQIFITVPHILQIMLLSPSNARDSKSWSNRVKRIIFDEVHCIGQVEDGIVWEQLLLLAPCPIIALSATVGNPHEFKSWLEGAQKVKGFDLEMIIHNSRYSDLRKYIFHPPSSFEFKGLTPVERLPLSGLEYDVDSSSRFSFVHPVGALVGR